MAVGKPDRLTRPAVTPDDERTDIPLEFSAERESPERIAPSAQHERRLISEAGHAIRRQWGVSLTAGLVVGAAVAAAVWFGVSRQYTATAVLRVAEGRENLLTSTNSGRESLGFDIYKRTQRQYIRSPHVLSAVLQQKSIESLRLVAAQSDPVTWLQQILSVNFPDDAEIMQVSVRSEDRETAEHLANAVADAYLEDVNGADRRARMDRMSDLEKAYTESETNLRRKRQDLRNLAETFGTGDGEALTLSQSNAVQEFSTLCNKKNEVEMELLRRMSMRPVSEDAASDKTASKGNEVVPGLESVSPIEIEIVAATDVTIAGYMGNVQRVQAEMEKTRHDMTEEKAPPVLADQQRILDQLNRKIENRKGFLRKELAYKKQWALESAGDALGGSISALQVQQKSLNAKVAAFRKEADRRPSIEIELMRAEIKAMEEIRNFIQRELHETRVELASVKNRTTKLSPAVAPQYEARQKHLELCEVLGSLGFFAPGALVVLWDMRRRRLNTAQEAAKIVGVPLLGTIPGRWRRRKGQYDPHQEAIDAIAATMVFSTPEDSHRLLLVTSAAPGEGKTTLAAGLAMSLANMGRPTLLVDFDLRRPMLNEMFDIDLVPGTGDVLAERLEPMDAVQPTAMENLSIVPAGDWGQRGLGTWSNDRLKKLFAEYRLSFAHVVIDSGPVLASVETRLLLRHADGVLVSLLRDVSELSRIHSAFEQLGTFEGKVLGAVMIGVTGELYYKPKPRSPYPTA